MIISDQSKHPDVSTAVKKTKKVLFSSKGHNMQYFDIEGIKQRTSYSNIEDLYTAVIKEQLDNAIDWLHDNCKGSKAEVITAVITISKGKINYRFRNTNPQNIEIVAFHPEVLKEIFDFDKTYGSKQNRHVFGRRGLFGDASKFIAGIAYALIHSQGTKDTAFYNTQWKELICFRSNGIERQVLIEVNRAASIATAHIPESPYQVGHTDTEVEVTLPIININPSFLTDKIEKYCQRYYRFTKDITFRITVIDKTATTAKASDVRLIEKEATEPIPEKSKTDNLPRAQTYNPGEFVRFFLGFADRESTTVYDVLTELKEGTQIPKKDFDNIVGSDVYSLSLIDFIKDPKYESKLKLLYRRLRRDNNNRNNNNKKQQQEEATTGKNIKSGRKEAVSIIQDIASMYPAGFLDVSRSAYQQIQGVSTEIQEEGGGDKKDPTWFRYKFTIVAVPLHKDIIKKAPDYHKCEFTGFINSSLSPTSDRGSVFEGRYEWLKKGSNYHSYGDDILDVLQEYGFVFSSDRKSKSKVPCVITANLESEKFYYQTAAKQARIDITSFSDGIVKAVEQLAKKVHTFKSIGITFITDKEKYAISKGSGEARTTIKDIVEMMLLPRIEKVKAGQKITTEQTQDSLWYNALPLFERYDVKYSNDSRAHFKNCIRQLCKEHGIAREEIGIIASPWASMFFKGEWYDVSFDTIQDLAEKGTDIVFIEKRDIVRALGKYASSVGVALVNTHGLLSDYAEDLAELANTSGAHIAIFTDYDIPGLLIASKLNQNVPRLGVDERMLRHFGISHGNTRLVIPYNAKKDRLGPTKLRLLIKNDKRFNSNDIDIDFLKYEKIEIDAILSEVGAKTLWQYLQDLLQKEFPTRDYTRVIDPTPDLSKHYPPIIEKLRLYFDKVTDKITKEESEKIEEELEDVEGFIDVEKMEKEILDDRLGKIVKEDKHLTEVAEALVKLVEEKGWNKILEVEAEITPPPSAEENGGGGPKF